MKLYTRGGDDGTTGLFGGKRIRKDDLHIEATGTVDELNCVLGLARAGCIDAKLTELLAELQSELFALGADLATPLDRPPPAGVARMHEERIHVLEKHIDALWEPLPAMRNFILPGGSELAARLHLARAVCRRAERLCVALAQRETINPHILIYLNRLSDLLFAAARHANRLAGVEDIPWGAPSRGAPSR